MGSGLSDEEIDAAVSLLPEAVAPRSDAQASADYRRNAVKVLGRRALRRARDGLIERRRGGDRL